MRAPSRQPRDHTGRLRLQPVQVQAQVLAMTERILFTILFGLVITVAVIVGYSVADPFARGVAYSASGVLVIVSGLGFILCCAVADARR